MMRSISPLFSRTDWYSCRTSESSHRVFSKCRCMAGPSERWFKATVLARRGLVESSSASSSGRSSARTCTRVPACTISSTCSTTLRRGRGMVFTFSRLAIDLRLLHADRLHQVVQGARVVREDLLGLDVGLEHVNRGCLHLSDFGGEILDLPKFLGFQGWIGLFQSPLSALKPRGF